jgi:hypothetical protein
VLTSGSNAAKKLSQEVSHKIKGYFPLSWILSPKLAIVMYTEMLQDFKKKGRSQTAKVEITQYFCSFACPQVKLVTCLRLLQNSKI